MASSHLKMKWLECEFLPFGEAENLFGANSLVLGGKRLSSEAVLGLVLGIICRIL